MKNKQLILFTYCGELFVFLKLFTPNHVSWWWLVLFILTDIASTEVYKSRKEEYAL